MKRLYLFTVSLLLLLVAAAACASQNAPASVSSGGLPPVAQMPTALPTMAAMATSAAPAEGAERALPPGQADPETRPVDAAAGQDVARVILRDATISIRVADVQARMDDISAMADEMGGWVVSANTTAQTYSTGRRLTGTIALRVPAARLNEALERIRTDVEEVISQAENGRDVTAQYVDVASRLANMEAAEAQLQTLMDRAETVEEVLEVFTQLNRVRGDVESLRGQLNYFDEAAAFSLITVTVQPVIPSVVETQTTGWSLQAVVEDAFGTLISAMQGLLELAVTLVIVGVPLLLVVGVPLLLVGRRVLRFRRT